MNRQSENYDRLLSRFFPSGSWKISQGASGMNNTTRYVETGPDRYILRVYETHRDEAKVEYEHAILLALRDMALPFHTPEPVHAQGGSTTVRLENGKLAALFHYLEGTNPSYTGSLKPYSFGAAAGSLTSALARVNIDRSPAYPPYYEIENTHPRCSPGDVIRFCENPPPAFASHGQALLSVGRQFTRLQDSLPKLKQLPHQLIHGDMNASNVLADEEGHITAILDFEFITRDLRVMELAVCLSDLINSIPDENQLWNRMEQFLAGYGSVIRLTPEETRVIPLLVQLRRLDVFIHFLGRYQDGINTADIVIEQVYSTVSQSDWLETNADRLEALCGHFIF